MHHRLCKYGAISFSISPPMGKKIEGIEKFRNLNGIPRLGQEMDILQMEFSCLIPIFLTPSQKDKMAIRTHTVGKRLQRNGAENGVIGPLMEAGDDGIIGNF